MLLSAEKSSNRCVSKVQRGCTSGEVNSKNLGHSSQKSRSTKSFALYLSLFHLKSIFIQSFEKHVILAMSVLKQPGPGLI